MLSGGLVFNEPHLGVCPFCISVVGLLGPVTAYGGRGEIGTCLPV